MTTEELKEILQKDENSTELFVEFIQNEGWYNEDESPYIFGQYKLEFVEGERLSDGDHDTYQYVFKVGEQYFALRGYYSSHNGISFDDYFDFFEVKQVEKKIIVWERIKK